MNTAVARSPFDGLIDQIKQNPQHLSFENARVLLEVVKAQFPKIIQPSDGLDNMKSPQDLLKSTINDLGETIKKINMAASVGVGNEGPSPGDLSKLLAGQEKYIKILERLSSTLTSNERQAALENAISEALDEIDDKSLKETFLKKFRSNLAEKSKEMSKMG